MYIIYQDMPINMFQIEVLYIHYTKHHLVSTVLQKKDGPISSAFKYLVALGVFRHKRCDIQSPWKLREHYQSSNFYVTSWISISKYMTRKFPVIWSDLLGGAFFWWPFERFSDLQRSGI